MDNNAIDIQDNVLSLERSDKTDQDSPIVKRNITWLEDIEMLDRLGI